MQQGRSSFFIIIFISIVTSVSSLYADVTWDAVEIQCVPELGHLKFTTTLLRGYQLLSLEDEEIEKLIATKGIILNGRDAVGQCQLGEDTFKWMFTDYYEPGKGQCGAGYWGGTTLLLYGDCL